MNHKVMCPSKHMKTVLLHLQDQYNTEQRYGKKREENRGSWRKEKLYPLPPQKTVMRVNHWSTTHLLLICGICKPGQIVQEWSSPTPSYLRKATNFNHVTYAFWNSFPCF